MKTQHRRICSLLLCLLLTLLQIPSVHAEETPGDEPPISVSVSIRENADNQYLVQPLTLSCPSGTTAAGLLPILQKYAYLTGFQMSEDTLLAVTLEENGLTRLIGGDGVWNLQTNGVTITESPLPPLADGDRVEWIYHPVGERPDSGTEELLPEVAPAVTSALWNDACANALSGACSWLRSNGTRNSRFTSLGSAGVSVDYQDIDELIQSVLEEQSYETAASVASDILAVTFCGIYAGNVSGTNLLTTLSNYPDISRGGSYGAILALLAADSNGYSLPSDGINTRSTLRAVILGAQNDDGGFAPSRGEDSSAYLTACAITALSRYTGLDEIRNAVQEGFSYLSAEQLPGGGFTGSETYSSGRTTAAVLTALCAAGLSPDGADFTKPGGSPLDALLTYRTEDGGFSAELDGVPEEQATEQAILALVSLKGSRSGYVLRTAIQAQDASSSQPPDEDSSTPSESSDSSDHEEIIKRKNILAGSLGLAIGVVLGALLLFGILFLIHRGKRPNP